MKTLLEWIKDNREVIDQVIREAGVACQLTDEDREDWVANDEGLYNLALEAGVEV